jgi:mRNA-degrading endonuclease RelE of RelBE toxin-antitoxin system
MKARFDLDFSPDSQEHLASLRKVDQVKVISAIESRLSQEPLTPARNRKPMRSNLIATWELRVGNFRVYYDVDADQRIVLIRAVGLKDRNRILIGGEQVDLS